MTTTPVILHRPGLLMVLRGQQPAKAEFTIHHEASTSRSKATAAFNDALGKGAADRLGKDRGGITPINWPAPKSSYLQWQLYSEGQSLLFLDTEWIAVIRRNAGDSPADRLHP